MSVTHGFFKSVGRVSSAAGVSAIGALILGSTPISVAVTSSAIGASLLLIPALAIEKALLSKEPEGISGLLSHSAFALAYSSACAAIGASVIGAEVGSAVACAAVGSAAIIPAFLLTLLASCVAALAFSLVDFLSTTEQSNPTATTAGI